MANRLADRIALITGASRGIGAALARGLAGEGAHVIAVARTQGALEELDDQIGKAGGSATLVPMDLSRHELIDDLGRQIFERWGRLDVLIGNAAILGDLAPAGHIAPEVWQAVFDLNVTANWRLIRAMDPLLRQSDAGRGIFLTSGATRSLQPYWAAYSSSKAALEALVATYAKELRQTGVRVNLVNPGPTRTALRAHAFPGENAHALPPPEHLLETVVQMALPSFDGNGLWVAADVQPGAPVASRTPH